MKPPKDSAVLPRYYHVTAHTFTGDRGINNFWGPEVVPGWPALALVSYLLMGTEENTSETHQNYLRNKDHKRKWSCRGMIELSPLQRDKI